MKKQILNLGKALNKAEQKSINGGDCFTPYLCYGEANPLVTCGTCEEYNQLSQYCKSRVINSCF
ncbi:MAG: hypothetical protein ABJH82_12540 [Polaribacter sp.]|uniref:hypothetical protein n=1 Tax=Polaribacter sp. TaxID=1920175 RepID=UPI0032646023